MLTAFGQNIAGSASLAATVRARMMGLKLHFDQKQAIVGSIVVPTPAMHWTSWDRFRAQSPQAGRVRFARNVRAPNDPHIPLSVQGGAWLDRDARLPLDFPGRTTRDAQVPLEFNEVPQVRRDAQVPLEFQGLSTVFRDARIPLDFLGPTTRDARLPVDWTGSAIFRDAQLPLDFGGIDPNFLLHRWLVLVKASLPLLHAWDVRRAAAEFPITHTWTVLEPLPGLPHRWNVTGDVLTPFGVDPNTGAPLGGTSGDIQCPVATKDKTP